MNIDHLSAWIGVSTGVPIIAAFTYKLVRRGEKILQTLQSLQSDLRPNGGSSFADQVNRRFGEMHGRLDEVASTAREAADAASRAEVIGNLDRAEIRRSLSSIQETSAQASSAASSAASSLNAHLTEAERERKNIDERLDRIEKLRSA